VLLPARARAANVRGAFRARGDGVAGKSVLLIDDVYTTGATLSECARVLRRAGASRVYVLTVARPYPGRPRLPAPQSRC
jgi:predicted amidophosphoribosyltransferase